MWPDKISPSAEIDSVDSAVLLTKLRPALFGYFRRRCGNTAEAEDLAQDVILRALTHAHWTSVEEAKNYIFQIAVNRWRERGRRKLTHVIEVDWNEEQMSAVAEEIALERIVGGEAEFRRMVQALQKLEERTRAVLVLCRFEQRKQAEIAEILGISVSAVEKHLVKGITYLTQKLKHDADE